MQTKMNFTDRVRSIEVKFAERMPAFKADLDSRGPRLYRRFCIREANEQVIIEIMHANTPPRKRERVAQRRSLMRWEAK